MMKYVIAVSLTLGLSACATTAEIKTETDHPFVGCWESENGLKREVWTQDPSGWLFGYALDRNEDGDVTFFEQMRLETSNSPHRLVISARDGDPVTFTQVESEMTNAYRFENPEHDFPQVITYLPSSDRLDAWISDIDVTQRIEFKKRKCQGN